jgi:hypothetical protein
MFQIILDGRVSKRELEEDYTLEDYFKLHALWRMEKDVDAALRKEAEQE